MSFCIPRRSLCHRTAFSSSLCTRSLALRLLAFPLRVFPTPLQRARARVPFFFSFFRALSPRPSSPLFAVSPFCWSFYPTRLRVFLARLLPFPDPFILLPSSPPLPLGVSPFFSVFVSFLERSSTSATPFPSLAHFASLFFVPSFSFPVVGLPQPVF